MTSQFYLKEEKKILQAIKNTLSYAQIFHYPLTEKEIWRFLIWEDQKNSPDKKTFTKLLTTSFKKKENFYYFSSDNIIAQRKEKEKSSLIKIKIAHDVKNLLKKIPTVKFIGISGALALSNASEDDDIDFFLICQKNTLWITRFITTILLDFKNMRRKPNDLNIKNKICLNMLFDEKDLTFSDAKKNLYTAHEIVQLIPIYNKENTYEKFLSANFWVKNYLPNGLKHLDIKILNQKNTIVNIFLNIFCFLLNNLFMYPQLFYMRSRRTREILTSKQIFFHPHDLTEKILNTYQRIL